MQGSALRTKSLLFASMLALMAGCGGGGGTDSGVDARDASDVATTDAQDGGGIDVPGDIQQPADVLPDVGTDVAQDTPQDTPPAPYNFSVETFNVGLAGSLVPFESASRPAILSTLAGSTADFVCVQEAWRQSDKDMIIAAMRSRFPNSVSVMTDLNTPVDSFDPGCDVPPEPTVAPCNQMETRNRLSRLLTCLQTRCSTIPGSASGQLTSTSCAQEACFTVAAEVLFAPMDGASCYGCVAPNLTTETFSSIESQCTTNPRAGLAFGGQNGVIALSRFPIVEQQQFVLPGTWNRRVSLRTRVELPNRAQVDVYCNHFTAIFDSAAFPYTGRYGCGLRGREGWTQEILIQSQYMIDRVRTISGSRRALFIGDFNVGPAYTGPGTPIIGEGPDNFAVIEAAFPNAIPMSTTPLCTWCPATNELISEANANWLDHVMLYNIPRSATQSYERVYDMNVVPVTVPTPGDAGVDASADGSTTMRMVPLSDHYGIRASVRIEP